MKRDVAAVVVGLLCLTTAVGVTLRPPSAVLAIAVPVCLIAIGLIGLILIPRKSHHPRKETR